MRALRSVDIIGKFDIRTSLIINLVAVNSFYSRTCNACDSKSAISILLYFVSNKYLSEHEVNQKEEEDVEESHMNVLRFLLRPRVIGFFVLLMTPLLICGYFQNYMLPIVGSEWGLSDQCTCDFVSDWCNCRKQKGTIGDIQGYEEEFSEI